jgi:endonuclease/exonuclease/phosphatase (EEP) superfamily protein YafD
MTLRGLLQAAAVVTIVFSIFTLLPVEHHALQLFTHFRLQYLLAAVALLVALAALRETRYAAALLLVAIVNAYVLLPWYVGERPATSGVEMRVLLANIHARNEDHEKLLTLVDNEQPDVLVLLEVTRGWAASLRRLHPDYPHRVIEPRDGSFGVALFSKLPITAAATVDSAPLGLPTIVATLEVGKETLQVLATHPMIPVGKDNYEARNRQLDDIARLLQQMSGPRVLVGDLNTSMWDTNYDSLENRTWLRNARRGFGVLPTWPTFMPFAMIPIDHVLVSEDIGVRDARTGPRIGSDHLPLAVTITL